MVRLGSIPAPAGEPAPARPRRPPCKVYPRACGGTPTIAAKILGSCGLSPRLRGNLKAPDSSHIANRSIPAPAGEPLPRCGPTHSKWVYPRACGGTGRIYPTFNLQEGLSPRLRGNRAACLAALEEERSIPAPAGEPLPAPGFLMGTRSIPAPAGEPGCSHQRPGALTVYPRACGGTIAFLKNGRSGMGLSPRLRGNRRWCGNIPRWEGSIPAPAGEPCRGGATAARTRVYPRACGGTVQVSNRVGVAYGLSPRLRGNLLLGLQIRIRVRSIPAPAGEPAALALHR